MAGGTQGINYIYAGRVISGIGIGGISAISPVYVSEYSPKNTYGRITGVSAIMGATGIMISNFVNRRSALFFTHKISSRVLYSRCWIAPAEQRKRLEGSVWTATCTSRFHVLGSIHSQSTLLSSSFSDYADGDRNHHVGRRPGDARRRLS